jgi:hypothetical protein
VDHFFGAIWISFLARSPTDSADSHYAVDTFVIDQPLDFGAKPAIGQRGWPAPQFTRIHK